MHRHTVTLAFVFGSACGLTNVRADVKLPAIFSDHMVVQANVTVPVWGWADSGEGVTVTIGKQSKTARAGADGKWTLKLDKMSSTSDPQTMTVKGKNSLTINDVLIGEVWLASGQSNMAFTVASVKNAQSEIAAANHPTLRMFKVASNPQRAPQYECTGRWDVCTPQSVNGFSAVAYFFGRELNQKLNVPVGMINSSVGGTDIAAWTSEDVQTPIAALKAGFDAWKAKDVAYTPEGAKAAYEKQLAAWTVSAEKAKAEGKPTPRKPTLQVQPRTDRNHPANLFNGMIAPLIPYAIHGAIWYQGEHNTGSEAAAKLYYTQLPLMVNDWRSRWGYDFPFAWVQLPNLDGATHRPIVRDAMLQSLKLKHTGMAVTTDVGEAKDNHPKNKQDVGLRLAMWALGDVYGKKVATSGPLPNGTDFSGGNVVVRFKHTDGGLVSKGGDALKGFVIAGDDGEWKPAQAKIDGDTVVVSNSEVKKPVAVRYAWTGNPDGNLFNGAGLPASPFKTDCQD
jgi:hypothetical protein